MTEHESRDVKQLGAWLAQRRWYGDKTRQLEGVEPMFRAELSAENDEVTIEVVRLVYSAGASADYLLLRASGAPDADGIESETVRAWLLSGLLDGRVLHGDGDARLTWNRLDGSKSLADAAGGTSRVFGGEQSNSSIVYDHHAILKLFRRIREGLNPEVEIGEFLTRHTEFTAFPRLLGTIDLVRGDSVTTVAAIQEFIPSVGDAWTWVTERIGDQSQRAGTVDAAGVLGRRTAEMHVAFATGRADRFVPEVASGAYAEAVRAEARAELEDTVEQLARRGVGGAAALGATLETSLDALVDLEGTMITRVHGDYHLGQLLRTTDDDFAILDFEGEPSRSLAERRAKASPLRDVAGMLRSFDYAAESARRASGSVQNGDIGSWYDESRMAFLNGYHSVARENSVLMRGWEPGARTAVLAALEVHKALYEVRYELSNRPDWLEIPLNALRRLADAA